MISGALQLPDDVKACTPESINPSHEQITRTSLEAHQTLMAMNPDNVARFKDVTQFLAEDLRAWKNRPDGGDLRLMLATDTSEKPLLFPASRDKLPA